MVPDYEVQADYGGKRRFGGEAAKNNKEIDGVNALAILDGVTERLDSTRRELESRMECDATNGQTYASDIEALG